MRRHVLAVEDQELIAKLMRAQLSAHFDVTVCLSGDGAWQSFASDPSAVDVALLDWNLPGIAGLTLASLLWSRRSDLPVLFISGNPDVRHLVPAGAHVAFLAKPYSGSQLVTAVHGLLAASSAHAVPDT